MSSTDPIDPWTDRTTRILSARGYSVRTIKTYSSWIRRFLAENPTTLPRHLTRSDVETYLEVLTTQRHLAPKSRNQAASALVFFFREVLGRDALDNLVRAREPKRTLSCSRTVWQRPCCSSSPASTD